MQSILILPRSTDSVDKFLRLLHEVLSGTDNYKLAYDDESGIMELICEDKQANFIFLKSTEEIPGLLLFINSMNSLN